MNGFRTTIGFAQAALLWFAASGAPGLARADDIPSPCASLKRIVAARADGFSTLTPTDASGIAQPYGRDPHCAAAGSAYQCEWTPQPDARTPSDALESVAADIAACLPDATHDVNSPARQHFYLGERGQRTQIAVTAVGGGRIRLTVSGR